MRRLLLRAALIVLLIFGSVESVRGLWIPAKAELAQVLMQRAWRQSRAEIDRARPWPWADTWPVARLRLPDHGVDLIVLAGSSGATMAFAPGHLHGSAAPGEDGICVISGHRDTHFAVLEDLDPGQRVELEDRTGARHGYVVTETVVVHEREIEALGWGGPGSLVLMTCWPFDSVRPGGELRFLVYAEIADSRRNSCPSKTLSEGYAGHRRHESVQCGYSHPIRCDGAKG